MSQARWQRMIALFEEALTRPPEERDAFLHEACAGDLTLQCAVEALLKADREAGGFLEGSFEPRER